MLVDLLLLTIIGCLLEGFASAISTIVFVGTPSFTFALLITFIAVCRWNLWGLLVIPFMALANMIGGMNSQLDYLGKVYDWRFMLSSALGLTTVGLNVVFFKRKGTNQIINSQGGLAGLIIMDYLLYSTIQFLVYRLLTSGTILHNGEILYEYMKYIPETETLKPTTVNLCLFGENALVYNLFGLAVTFLGLYVLRSQGVVDNVIDKLKRDREEMQLSRINNDDFSIK